jgi:hypothetical protein
VAVCVSRCVWSVDGTAATQSSGDADSGICLPSLFRAFLLLLNLDPLVPIVGISTSHYSTPHLTLCTTQCASSAGELDASRDNLKVAREILALRVQQATMHGYANYAEYATADTMAGKPAKVMELLEVSGADGAVCECTVLRGLL